MPRNKSFDAGYHANAKGREKFSVHVADRLDLYVITGKLGTLPLDDERIKDLLWPGANRNKHNALFILGALAKREARMANIKAADYDEPIPECVINDETPMTVEEFELGCLATDKELDDLAQEKLPADLTNASSESYVVIPGIDI